MSCTSSHCEGLLYLLRHGLMSGLHGIAVLMCEDTQDIPYEAFASNDVGNPLSAIPQVAGPGVLDEHQRLPASLHTSFQPGTESCHQLPKRLSVVLVFTED